MSRITHVIIGIFVLALVGLFATAPVRDSDWRGIVLDEDDRPLAGAVAILADSSGVFARQVTAADGRFDFRVGLGRIRQYTFSLCAAGRHPFVRQDILAGHVGDATYTMSLLPPDAPGVAERPWPPRQPSVR